MREHAQRAGIGSEIMDFGEMVEALIKTWIETWAHSPESHRTKSERSEALVDPAPCFGTRFPALMVLNHGWNDNRGRQQYGSFLLWPASIGGRRF
jgi:hypothetical protein